MTGRRIVIRELPDKTKNLSHDELLILKYGKKDGLDQERLEQAKKTSKMNGYAHSVVFMAIVKSNWKIPFGQTENTALKYYMQDFERHHYA